MYAYNLRCLKRALSSYAASTWLGMSVVVPLITKYKAVETHIAGHDVLDGDPGADVFASPRDPEFW